MAVSIYKKFFGRAHPLETFSDLRARALAACSFPGGPTQELETFKFFLFFYFSSISGCAEPALQRARYSKLYSCGLANHLLPVVISENLQDFAAIDAAYFIKVPNFRSHHFDQ